MRTLASLFAAFALLAIPMAPAHASLVAATPAIDNMHCLSLLFSDPDAHAAECGGPFTIDKGTAPLGGSSYGEGCHVQITMAAPPSLDNLDLVQRLLVADIPDKCCQIGSLFETPILSFGEEIVVAGDPCSPI
ncbi:MAG TPA: hypothetical protein VG757_08620 [Devosia sp.]|nr:hypothetical protein [Devosia sp.]